MFENFRVFETEFAGRKMTFETGKMCCQAGPLWRDHRIGQCHRFRKAP